MKLRAALLRGIKRNSSPSSVAVAQATAEDGRSHTLLAYSAEAASAAKAGRSSSYRRVILLAFIPAVNCGVFGEGE